MEQHSALPIIHIKGIREELEQPKKLPSLQACGKGIRKTRQSSMKHKTCLVAHNYALSSANRMHNKPRI